MTWSVSDELSGIASASVSGQPLNFDAAGVFTATINLIEGRNTLDVEALDAAGNRGSATVDNVYLDLSPIIVITSPANSSVVDVESVDIESVVSDGVALVTVDGNAAQLGAGTFTAAGVSLAEGLNVLTAVATDSQGRQTEVSILLLRDLVGSGSAFVLGRSRRLRLSRIVTDTALLPGQTGCFIMFTLTPRAAVESVDLAFNFESFETDRLLGKVQLDGPVNRRADAVGDLELNGRMRNSGDRLTFLNAVVYSILSGGGRSLGCGIGFVQGSTVTLADGITTDTGLSPG